MFSSLFGETNQKVTFFDHYNNEVTLEKPAERIITIPKPAPSMFMAVDGSSERIVGIHPGSMDAIREGIMMQMFPDAININSDIGNKGSYIPNVEEMLTLHPDIIFQWGNEGMGIVDPIKNAGLKVALVKYGDQNSLETMLNSFGSVSGKKDKVETIIAWHKSTMSQLKQKTDIIPESGKTRVIFLIRALSSLKVAGGDTYHGLCIGLAGGKNPAREIKGYKVVSPEQIIAWDPEVIFLNNFEAKLQPQDIYSNAMLAGLSAVKNKRVYRAPMGGYRWDPPNQESPLMWKWLSMIFYPDQISWDIRTEMKEKYQFLYNYTLKDDEIDAILRFRMNGISSNYQQFARTEG